MPGAPSRGKIKSRLRAASVSPIRKILDQVIRIKAASRGHPHNKASDAKANATVNGIAGWWVAGSSTTQAYARSHLPTRYRFRIGLLVATALMVSEYRPSAFLRRKALSRTYATKRSETVSASVSLPSRS